MIKFLRNILIKNLTTGKHLENLSNSLDILKIKDSIDE